MKKTEDKYVILQAEIDKIKARNRSVELDKKWETSNTRKLLIAILTYLVISIYMAIIHVSRPFLNAIVPTTGFVFSTLTLQYFKKLWIKRQIKNS